MIALRTAVTAVAALASIQLGCNTEAYCFDHCEGDESDAGIRDGDVPTDVRLSDSGTGGSLLNLDADTTGGQGGSRALAINDENCNGKDDDGDGEIDEDVDFASVLHCGTCDNNCAEGEHLINPTCDPPPQGQRNGSTPGTCRYERCETDFYDLDPLAPGCEYYCQWNPDGTNTVDTGNDDGCGRDDDCDGEVDEDVDTCDGIRNCGRCGKTCVTPNGTPECVTTASDGEDCTEDNTHCHVVQCDDGWVDANGSAADGCEYQCTETNDGVEVCDGLDNDCDKLIDNADPSLESDDVRVGADCFGGEVGVCAASNHQGVAKCIGAQVRCCDPESNNVPGSNDNFPTTGLRNAVCDASAGNQVVRPGELDEICNGLDDDCDDRPDNNLTDVGSSCGFSAAGNCTMGTLQCVSGTPTCIGSTDPQAETCNAQDDDCDGIIDGTAADPAELVECTEDTDCIAVGELCLTATTSSTGRACGVPSSDSVGACDTPAPVVGGTSACSAGTFRCVNGIKKCQNSIRPEAGAVDTCGVDADCDGQLDNQPNTDTDLRNCGTCGNVCGDGGPFSKYQCVDGSCVFLGCVTGRIDCDSSDGNDQCETECVKTANEEACNGLDDDCDCYVDAADTNTPPPTPTPVQVCGVSPAATDAGCTSQVQVECVTVGASASWECTFPGNYCSNPGPDYCVGVTDPCNGADDNCNGFPDEAYRHPWATGDALGDACYVGEGACRSEGQFVCNGSGNGVECNATENLPAAEACNGVDDDCDGLVDENFAAKGSNSSFVQPSVVQLASSTWMFAYEASRPNATQFDSGSGNGYFNVAPTGETLDQTVACSVGSKLPWVNVSPDEVEQTCQAIGGRICGIDDWQNVCWVGSANLCAFGYSPAGSGSGAACQNYAAYGTGPFCNLGAFDYDGSSGNGNQSGLLPTASTSKLDSCAAEISTLFGNALDAYDMTGNAREITRCQRDRALCAEGVTDDGAAEAMCSQSCCAGTGTDTDSGPAGYQWLCGDLTNSRRLSGQLCRNSGSNSDYRCCDDDVSCTGSGDCYQGVCRNSTSDPRCLARGVECAPDALTDPAGPPPCCDGLPCVDGYCGGAHALPYSVYPLMGGGYVSLNEDGASCDFDFFKVASHFKLFDTGFRCCFDSNPTQ